MTLIPDLQRDLVEAAGRMSGPRLPMQARITAGLAAVAALVATVLFVAPDDSDDPSAPADPASPPQARPGPTPPEHPPEAPRPDVHPTPRGNSTSVRFEFAGVRYSVFGFRSQGSVCTALTEIPADPGTRGGSRACLGERLLRRGLADGHVHTFAGGGGRQGHTFTAGYARAEVAALSVIGSTGNSRVVLSEPWSPEPWRGGPIRFFYVVTDRPPESLPRSDDLRLRARLTNGQVIQPAP
jgi:hypothetical protein